MVAVPELLMDEDHNENTCPWHSKTTPKVAVMEPMDPDEDTEAMPPNDGGKLGRNLNGSKEHPPTAQKVKISYEPGTAVICRSGKKAKSVQPYESNDDTHEYGLQYAPHHLIPGNESLKGTAVVPFLGDDDVIAEFAAEDAPSKIKKGQTVGYDVNRAANGVWLPSPYALSMQNLWPGDAGVTALKKRKLYDLAGETEDFHMAYVAASITASGDRQFHMRHKKYSDKVSEILEAIGTKLTLMVGGACSIAARNEDGKFNAPTGLRARLDVLSGSLKSLLIGPVWRPPLYTDKLTEKYTIDMKLLKTKASGNIRKVM